MTEQNAFNNPPHKPPTGNQQLKHKAVIKPLIEEISVYKLKCRQGVADLYKVFIVQWICLY